MTLAARCGVHSATREQACADLMARVRENGIEQVRIAWGDLHGTMRGKTLVMGSDGAALTDALAEGIGLVSTMFLKDTSDRTAFKVFEPGALAALDGFGAANNALLLPDPSSFLLLPWAPHTAWLRAEPFWPDGNPVLADPRGLKLDWITASAGRSGGHGPRLALWAGGRVSHPPHHRRAQCGRRRGLARRATVRGADPSRLPTAQRSLGRPG